MQLLSKDPAQRPASASDVARRLADLEAGLTAPSPAPSAPVAVPVQPAAPANSRADIDLIEPGSPEVQRSEPRPSGSGLVRPLLARARGSDRRRRLALGVAAAVLFIAAGVIVIPQIVIWIEKGGQKTKIEVPAGSKITIEEDGKVLAKVGEKVADKAHSQPAAPTKYTNSLGMEFALVPKGKSWLGGGRGRIGDKEVEIAYDFYLGVYEVTQEEWEKVTGFNPSRFKEVPGIPKEDLKRFPVENVSWEDAQLFLARVNKRDQQAGWVYRLPTEVEWEYACRGGPLADKFDSAFDFYFDKPTNLLLPEQGNFEHGKGLKRTCKVGSYPPNRLGLYDMHGNVSEWCQDEVPADPKDPKGASRRVHRGGCWSSDSGSCQAADRNTTNPPSLLTQYVGLRLARVPAGKEGK
jgi:formylglycine-generating enzyme required for sulfatase activity